MISMAFDKALPMRKEKSSKATLISRKTGVSEESVCSRMHTNISQDSWGESKKFPYIPFLQSFQNKNKKSIQKT